TIDEVSARIQELLEQQRRLRAAALRKRLLISAAGVVALAAAVFGVRELLRPPNLVPLRVTTSPAGASIKAGAEVCAASPACEFKLKPGVYTLEARLDGYKPVVQQVTVKGANAGSVALVLEPLRPQVQISTNFAS